MPPEPETERGRLAGRAGDSGQKWKRCVAKREAAEQRPCEILRHGSEFVARRRLHTRDEFSLFERHQRAVHGRRGKAETAANFCDAERRRRLADMAQDVEDMRGRGVHRLPFAFCGHRLGLSQGGGAQAV